MIASNVLSVSEVAERIQWLFRYDDRLSDCWVRGEVSDLHCSPAGHYYFSLRDEEAQLRCVMFRSWAQRSHELPYNGCTVLARGNMEFYAASGASQLLVKILLPEGVSESQLRFEALRLKLEAEGLFATARKRPLLPFPRAIGVVTSEAGAVIHDILSVLERRYPLAEVVVAHSSVQGERATAELVGALTQLNAWRRDGRGLDVVILARGGGSEDDLAVFNDERVVRAVYTCRAPVVSAVGHETNYTLVDLVADLRAATPSAAAELVSPSRVDLLQQTRQLRSVYLSSAAKAIARARVDVQRQRDHLRLCSPGAQMSRRQEGLRSLRQRARTAVSHRLASLKAKVDTHRMQTTAMDPRRTLERGYAICYDGAGFVVKTAGQVEANDPISVQLHRGRLDGTVRARRLE